MRACTLRKWIGIVVVTAGLAACSSSPAVNGSQRAQALQAQVSDLSRELDRLQDAAPADQEAIMHEYWDMLQRQLRYVRSIPGIVAHDCTDWTFMDPVITGRVPGATMSCPVVHDFGPAAGWEFPQDMNPKLFGIMMGHQLEMLRTQVDAIAAEPDDNKRLYLIRDYYDTRYQDIQTALGRSWMWTSYDAAELPDAQSMGAELLTRYCSQCHVAPHPQFYTRAEWQRITGTMHDIIQKESKVQVMGVRMPSSTEFTLIVSYLQSHAHMIAHGP